MAAWRFDATGSPSVISQAANQYLNGWINIQPDYTAIAGALATIGNLTTQQGRSNYVVAGFGETGKESSSFTIQVFAQPNLMTGT